MAKGKIFPAIGEKTNRVLEHYRTIEYVFPDGRKVRFNVSKEHVEGEMLPLLSPASILEVKVLDPAVSEKPPQEIEIPESVQNIIIAKLA